MVGRFATGPPRGPPRRAPGLWPCLPPSAPVSSSAAAAAAPAQTPSCASHSCRQNTSRRVGHHRPGAQELVGLCVGSPQVGMARVPADLVWGPPATLTPLSQEQGLGLPLGTRLGLSSRPTHPAPPRLPLSTKGGPG